MLFHSKEAGRLELTLLRTMFQRWAVEHFFPASTFGYIYYNENYHFGYKKELQALGVKLQQEWLMEAVARVNLIKGIHI
jgi:hypothetical protein